MNVHIPKQSITPSNSNGKAADEVTQILHDCMKMLRATGWREADAFEVYSTIFPSLYPSCEFGKFSDFSHPQPIFMTEYTDAEKLANPPKKQHPIDNRMHLHYMFSDTLYDKLDELVLDYGTCLCSGCEYRGNRNHFSNAQKLCALIIDVDYVGLSELQNLTERFLYTPDDPQAIPYPSLVVLSGSGVHLYYIFDTPIELFPNTEQQLRQLKYALECRISVFGITSRKEKPDHLPLNQSFRMIGSLNKKYGTTVTAFTDSATIRKISIDDLNAYVTLKERVDIHKPYKESKYSLAQAQKLFPEWYENVVINGRSESTEAKWRRGDGLYLWWIAQSDKAVAGHRYFYFVCLAAYASKCHIPKDRFMADCWALYPKIAAIQHRDPDTGKEDWLTQKDIQNAIAAYDKNLYKMSVATIERLSGISIPRRHNRPDALSKADAVEEARRKLAEANAVRGKALQGRPAKGQTVAEWRAVHPDGSKIQCIRDTGLAKQTVYTWWDAGADKL